jgi:hypothetical protein
MNTTTPHEPGEKPRKTKACGAKTRGKNPDGSAKRCKKSGTGKGGRCDRHGGKSLAGAESGTFKHGRRSKYLVGAALERFTDAMADRRLMQIKQDVALVEVLITGLTAKLPAKGLQTEDLERRILLAVDRRRLLVAEEARRLAQFMATMKAVAEVIREFVTDDKQRRAAQARLTQLLLTERVGTVEDEGGDDGRTGTA